eukprot:1154495-Pelagomonas_calceolata.AAC.3
MARLVDSTLGGYGQYRLSHPHPGGLCGEWSWHFGVVCKVHCIVAARPLAGKRQPDLIKGEMHNMQLEHQPEDYQEPGIKC